MEKLGFCHPLAKGDFAEALSKLGSVVAGMHGAGKKFFDKSVKTDASVSTDEVVGGLFFGFW